MNLIYNLTTVSSSMKHYIYNKNHLVTKGVDHPGVPNETLKLKTKHFPGKSQSEPYQK